MKAILKQTGHIFYVFCIKFRCELLRLLWEPVTGWKDLVLDRRVLDKKLMLEWRAEE